MHFKGGIWTSYVYTFYSANIYGWIILESSTHVSVTGHPLHIDSGSVAMYILCWHYSDNFHKTGKYPFRVMLLSGGPYSILSQIVSVMIV